MSIRAMTDCEFKHYCRERNMKETDIVIANLIFKNDMTAQEVAEITNYSVPAIYQRRLIIKAKLGL